MNVFYFFIGACLASQQVLVFEHMQTNTDFFNKNSQCDNCQHLLSIFDLSTIMNFILLHGRCRYCKAKISRYLLGVEIIGGLLLLQSPKNSPLLLSEIVFFFFVGLCSQEDAQKMEFRIIYLLPVFIFNLLFNYKIWFQTSSLLIIPIFGILLYFSWQQKMGEGDLWIIIAIFLTFGFRQTNLIILLACVLFLFKNITNTGKPNPFVPSLFWSAILIFFTK